MRLFIVTLLFFSSYTSACALEEAMALGVSRDAAVLTSIFNGTYKSNPLIEDDKGHYHYHDKKKVYHDLKSE